jgi:tetratricopeptide (TPR) repeat protein
LDWLIPQRTFLDGRLELMGRNFLAQYVQSQEPGGIGQLLVQYQPDIVLFNPLHVPQWEVDLTARPDWRLAYLDSLNAVYLRKGYEDRIPALDFMKLLAGNNLSPSLLAQAPSLLAAEPPSPWECLGRDFFQSANYPNGLLNLGIFSSYAGNTQASELFFLQAIRQTRGRYPDFYYDLGLLYASANQREEAALCMKRVLRDKPQDTIARQILGL